MCERCFNNDNNLSPPPLPILFSSLSSHLSFFLLSFPHLHALFFSLRSNSILPFKEDSHFHPGSEVVLTGDPFIAGRWEELWGEEGQAGGRLQSGQSGWTRYTKQQLNSFSQQFGSISWKFASLNFLNCFKTVLILSLNVRLTLFSLIIRALDASGP